MKTRKLGKTNIMITELGYGCTAHFGKDFLGKQGITEEQALALIKTALESGIRFFDTGFNYGYAEERLGRCLASALSSGSIKREDIVIQTKGSETLLDDGSYGPNDFSADWIKKSIEISLKRLQLDYLDLFSLHSVNIEDISDELIYMLEDLKSQGVIKAYGAAGITDTFGEWLCKNVCFDYVMMTYNYSEAKRNELVDKLKQNGIGILSGGSLNRSLSKFNYIPKNRIELWYLLRALKLFRKDIKRSKKYSFINHVEGMTPQQISLAYVLENDGFTSAVFNTINPGHLRNNALASEMKLPVEIKNRLDSIK